MDVYSTYPGPDVNERKPAFRGGGRAQVKDMIKDTVSILLAYYY